MQTGYVPPHVRLTLKAPKSLCIRFGYTAANRIIESRELTLQCMGHEYFWKALQSLVDSSSLTDASPEHSGRRWTEQGKMSCQLLVVLPTLEPIAREMLVSQDVLLIH